MALNVEPIRDGIVPGIDSGREMVQFVAEKVAEYTRDNGAQPFAIAFVLVGPDHKDAATDAYSWTPTDEERSRLHCCAVASAVLMKRAIGV